MSTKVQAAVPQDHPREHREEQIGERKRVQRPSKYTWDRSTVTLETPLVELPKKAIRIPRPDFDANDKKIKDIEEQIKNAIERKKKIIEELILKSRESKMAGDNKALPLREQFKEKLEHKAKLSKDLDEAKKNYNDAKDKIKDLQDQQQKLKLKMKKAMDAEDIEQRLAAINHSLNNDLLNQTEEKKLITEKEALEKSLPFVKPINDLQNQISELNVKRKQYKEILDMAYTQFTEVRDEVSELVGGLDEIRNAKAQDKEKNDPLFDEIKKEYDAKIEKLKEQKKKAREDFRTLKERYDNEQEDVRYHDWVKKIQDNLRRDKQRQDREKQRLANEEADEKKMIEQLENPYLYEMSDCEQLIKYCELLLRSENKANQKDEEDELKEEKPNKVNEDDLKKEKLLMIAPKKELQRFPVNNKKKNQPAKKPQQKSNENTKKMLNLPLEILNAFENTKVRSPVFNDEVEASLAQAKEKLVYFTQQGEQELEKKKQEMMSGVRNQNRADADSDDKEKSANPMREQKVYLEKEADFPTL